MVRYMRIFKEIKTHLFYLLTKRNLYTILILNVVIIVLLLIESGIFKGYSYVDEYRNECLEIYSSSTFPFIKIIYIFLILFVNLTFFLGNYSKYGEFFIRDRKSKATFYLTKYLSVILFITIEFIFIYMVYEVIKMIMPYGDYPFRDLGTYYSLYLMGLYYLFLSSSLLMLSKSNFSLVIPIIIYWVGDVMVSTSTMDIITKIFLAMTINISAEDGLYFGYIHAYLLIFLNIVLSTLIVIIKET